MNIKKLKLTKEPILKKENYYLKNREQFNPNEYIKFQRESNVRNNWKKLKVKQNIIWKI